MRTGQCGKPPPRPSASLRSSFAWTLAGNGLYAAAQWATLSLAAKLGGSEMLGQYALAVALTTPLVMLSHLNLRAVLATDLDGRHPFRDYVAVRLGVSGLSLAGIAILALVSGHSSSLAAGRVALLLAYDRPRGAAGESMARSGLGAEVSILRAAIPLGVMLLLVSLNTNLPRYAIERFLGVGELGAFAAVASFMTVGSTAVNALGQATTPRLARHFSRRESRQFLRLTFLLAASMGGLGVAGVAVAAVFGATILGVVYRPEYAAHGGLLVGVMGAAIPSYMAAALGYAITAARALDAQ